MAQLCVTSALDVLQWDAVVASVDSYAFGGCWLVSNCVHAVAAPLMRITCDMIM